MPPRPTSAGADPTSVRTFLVVAREQRTDRNGGAYMTLTVRDEDLVDHAAKAWGALAHAFDMLQPGVVVELTIRPEVYQGNTSLTVLGVTPSDVPRVRFQRRTHLDVEALWAGLLARVEAMTEPVTRHVARKLMERPGFEEAFKRAPAARKMHNAWVGGLIEHVHSLCALADSVVPHYQTLFDMPISRDKVIFGLMFHDAGKIYEYDIDDPGFGYTAIGTFTPHMVLGAAWVYQAAGSFPDRKTFPGYELEVAHLMHILAAHHGRLDWGSPVRPASLEALLVHQLDTLDAKVMHAWDHVTGKPGATPGFSQLSRAEETSYYQPEGVHLTRNPADG
jgi:3'-5' exoribonuclease